MASGAHLLHHCCRDGAGCCCLQKAYKGHRAAAGAGLAVHVRGGAAGHGEHADGQVGVLSGVKMRPSDIASIIIANNRPLNQKYPQVIRRRVIGARAVPAPCQDFLSIWSYVCPGKGALRSHQPRCHPCLATGFVQLGGVAGGQGTDAAGGADQRAGVHLLAHVRHPGHCQHAVRDETGIRGIDAGELLFCLGLEPHISLYAGT